MRGTFLTLFLRRFVVEEGDVRVLARGVVLQLAGGEEAYRHLLDVVSDELVLRLCASRLDGKAEGAYFAKRYALSVADAVDEFLLDAGEYGEYVGTGYRVRLHDVLDELACAHLRGALYAVVLHGAVLRGLAGDYLVTYCHGFRGFCVEPHPPIGLLGLGVLVS